jgi:lipid A disaccharide synthetase
MNLPNDYTLVVKDHPEMHGKRSPSYLEKLLRTPNVKLIHHSISGLECLKKCDFLIAATGTTCWEAALLKKPTILLGKLGTHILLPNVKTINNYNEISNIILKFEKDNNFFFHNYDENLLKIISASRDEIFDCNYSKLWSTKYSSDLDIDKIYKKFTKAIDNFYV